MLSLWVRSWPLVGPAYRSVRKFAVPPRNSCGVLAAGLKASIFPRSVLNSARVISLVRHSALAGVTRAPLGANVAGVKGWMQVLASGVTRIFVVVARSF